MIRIVFIITGLGTGGAEIMLLNVLRHIDRHKFDPHVISLTSLGDFGTRIVDMGIPVDTVGMKPGRFSPFAIYRIVQIVKRVQPDVVHTWMYHADLLGGLASWLAGYSKIAWCIRNGTLDVERTKFTTHLVVNLCAMISTLVPRKILVCSERSREIHQALGYASERMVVIPNGVDLTRFQPSETAKTRLCKELGLPVESLIVALICRFDPQKNHEGFFKAARLLHRQLPTVNFVLAGANIDRSNKALMRIVTQAGLVQQTYLLGKRSDIADIMPGFDVLVSSSAYGEAFPNVLVEAMASGVPCVATDVGDSALIVGKAGYVVPIDDMSALANSVYSLLTLSIPDRAKLSLVARARVAENYEISNVVSQYEAFYQSLAAAD